MAGFDGAHVLVLADMGTDVAEDWQVVAAQQSFSTESSRNMLDGSVKGVDHALSSYGRMESTATLEGLVSFVDGTQEALFQKMGQREEVVLRYQMDPKAHGGADPRVWEAPALVSTISRTYPDNENSTFSCEFNLNATFAEVDAAGAIGSWQANTLYDPGDQVRENSVIFETSAGGTSGPTEPNWSTADATGETVTDGPITWERQ